MRVKKNDATISITHNIYAETSVLPNILSNTLPLVITPAPAQLKIPVKKKIRDAEKNITDITSKTVEKTFFLKGFTTGAFFF